MTGRPGLVAVPVRDGVGRRRAVQMRAADGEVVLIVPAPGACRMGPREFAEFLATLRIVSEVAEVQRRAIAGGARDKDGVTR